MIDLYDLTVTTKSMQNGLPYAIGVPFLFL